MVTFFLVVLGLVAALFVVVFLISLFVAAIRGVNRAGRSSWSGYDSSPSYSTSDDSDSSNLLTSLFDSSSSSSSDSSSSDSGFGGGDSGGGGASSDW